MQPGMKYTLSQINENVKKGDVSSEHFDIENSRGRGEFLMKELADERRILNGVEITPEGNKMHYFKRVLINYKDPKGPRDVTSFDEIKEEIDRLDPEEALCYFHIDHRKSKLSSVTVVVVSSRETKLRTMMETSGFISSIKINIIGLYFVLLNLRRNLLLLNLRIFLKKFVNKLRSKKNERPIGSIRRWRFRNRRRISVLSISRFFTGRSYIQNFARRWDFV
ncbi:hypothetical protein LEP1GSC170_1305 [Leptospira interrogans serovar Bataviae str. HAI135]|nr:hypothetical protein LEP1GSC170_1305 [Leptospira interrogans serovar Bataviae str. HAI135]